MKKTFFTIAVASIISSMIFIGCETSAQKVTNAEQEVADAQAKLKQAHLDSTAEYEKSKIEWARQTAENDQLLANYRAKIATEKKEAREKHEAQLAELEKRNNDLKLKINEYKEDGKSSWSDFKAGFMSVVDEFNQDMTAFGKSIENLTDKK